MVHKSAGHKVSLLKDSALVRRSASKRWCANLQLKTKMVLQGEYEAVRRFIYQLETSSEFIIIDGMSLAQAEANKPQVLTLDLSTYYRLGADGT